MNFVSTLTKLAEIHPALYPAIGAGVGAVGGHLYGRNKSEEDHRGAVTSGAVLGLTGGLGAGALHHGLYGQHDLQPGQAPEPPPLPPFTAPPAPPPQYQDPPLEFDLPQEPQVPPPEPPAQAPPPAGPPPGAGGGPDYDQLAADMLGQKQQAGQAKAKPKGKIPDHGFDMLELD